LFLANYFGRVRLPVTQRADGGPVAEDVAAKKIVALFLAVSAMTNVVTTVANANDDDGGHLFSEGLPSATTMFDAAGDFQFFVPGMAVGPHRPKPGLTLGFIDSGTTSRHPQLAGLVVEERTFVTGPVHDEIGHGTWVMLQTFIPAPEGRFGLYSAKVTRNGSELSAKTVREAFEWLVSKDVKIVNMSLGFERLTPDVEKLCKAIAAAESVMVVAAAGNLGPNVKVYPAACGAKNVISVGEVHNGQAAPSSGTGEIYAQPAPLLKRWSFLAQRGMEEARAGHLEEAKSLFAKSIAASENALALTQLALVFATEGNWAAALPLIERADQLEPNQPEVVQTLGAVLLALGEVERAMACFERALKLDSNNLNALLNLTRAWIAKEDYGRAAEMLERARTIDPNNSSVASLQLTLRKRSQAKP
jgi:hypothetical protein